MDNTVVNCKAGWGYAAGFLQSTKPNTASRVEITMLMISGVGPPAGPVAGAIDGGGVGVFGSSGSVAVGVAVGSPVLVIVGVAVGVGELPGVEVVVGVAEGVIVDVEVLVAVGVDAFQQKVIWLISIRPPLGPTGE